MVTSEVVVKNMDGLHSKRAAILIQKASNYKSSIWIEKDNKRANAKSLLGLLSLSIGYGDKVTVTAEGDDEYQAMDELKH